MANPLVRIILDKAGRPRRNGKFVSQAAYRAQQWRLRGGKLGTLAKSDRGQRVEAALRAELGAPPSGQSWFVIASKYPDKFEDYVSEYL